MLLIQDIEGIGSETFQPQNNPDVPPYHPAKITIPPQPTSASKSSKLRIHSPFLCTATAVSRLAASANLCPAIQSRGCRRIADDTMDAHTGTSYESTQFSTPPYLHLHRAYKSRSATWLRIKTLDA
ncbi:hypothetical protein BDN71DRAFT_1454833 [Pleurotus eryngii]|uniref:Uncharacterized protein n=1 Tax=Pleurotus eryngii TaxID=5323 RepID=A0A9P6DC07_PLEER|nr:hypothetical protein BDN71DRAFT_1454833 [Pleurotus eryngii]